MNGTPNFSNGVTGRMADAGADVLVKAGYRGVALGSGETPTVIATAGSLACALAKAFPAMLDLSEQGSRDTLLHPGPIGAEDLLAWQSMLPTHRAQHVLHHASDHLRGIAATLPSLHIGNPSHDAGLAFLATAIVALAAQMERAAAFQRREQEQRRVDRLLEEARRRAAKPKRVRKPAKRKGAVA